MKRLIVMGAAVEQLPGILKAKEMGYQVGVIDYNPNAIGIPYADKYYNVSTISPEGVYAAGKDFGTQGFLTLATDLPMRAVAYANEKLGIKGISQETALKATDKYEMIKALKEHGVATPWFCIADGYDDLERLKETIDFPCVMKPVDNAASRGVVLVNGADEIDSAYVYSKESSHCGRVIIEEYMRGKEVSVEVLCYQGKAQVLAVTDKLTTGAPHFVEKGHNQYSLLPEIERKKTEELAKQAVIALGIMSGPAHVEIIVTDEGPKIVELGARLGGDCITSHLVYLSTGVDMLKETIITLCGGKPDFTSKFRKGAAIRFLTSNNPGKLVSVEGIEKASAMDGIIEVSMIMQVGDEITGGIDSSDDRIAYVIAQNETPEAAILNSEAAVKIMKVIVE